MLQEPAGPPEPRNEGLQVVHSPRREPPGPPGPPALQERPPPTEPPPEERSKPPSRAAMVPETRGAPRPEDEDLQGVLGPQREPPEPPEPLEPAGSLRDQPPEPPPLSPPVLEESPPMMPEVVEPFLRQEPPLLTPPPCLLKEREGHVGPMGKQVRKYEFDRDLLGYYVTTANHSF
jgi:hypothetical protein